MMIKISKNKIDYKNYNTSPGFNHKSYNYALTANQFVVPWQMEEARKEKMNIKID